MDMWLVFKCRGWLLLRRKVPRKKNKMLFHCVSHIHWHKCSVLLYLLFCCLSSGLQTPPCGRSTWGWQSSRSTGLSRWLWSRSYTTFTTGPKDWTTTLRWWNWPPHSFSMVIVSFYKTLLSPHSLSHPALCSYIHSFIAQSASIASQQFRHQTQNDQKVNSLVRRLAGAL